MKKLFYLIILMNYTIMTSCASSLGLDKLFPDKQAAYRENEPMETLEIPPDLIVDTLDDALVIPGEKITTFSQYEHQRDRRSPDTLSTITETGSIVGKSRLVLEGPPSEFWPRLEAFCISRGYQFDLNDAELGVIETEWQARIVDGGQYRDKLSLFAEPMGSSTHLSVAIHRQKEDNEGWSDMPPDADLEASFFMELKAYLHK